MVTVKLNRKNLTVTGLLLCIALLFSLFFVFDIKRRIAERDVIKYPDHPVEKFGSVEMVYIKGGKFTMGCPSCDINPPHEYEVLSFYISKYEITQKIYKKVTGKNPSKYKGFNRPVESVNWYDAVEFCNKLSEMHGLKPYYTIDKNTIDEKNLNVRGSEGCEEDCGRHYDPFRYKVTIKGGDGFRLPFEAEWEYACRAGTTTDFHYGNILNSTLANIDSEARLNTDDLFTVDVGSYRPNRFGLYDMHGNVREWCFDWGDFLPNEHRIDITEEHTGSLRVLRGGAFSNDAYYSKSGNKGGGHPDWCYETNGFRVARSVE